MSDTDQQNESSSAVEIASNAHLAADAAEVAGHMREGTALGGALSGVGSILGPVLGAASIANGVHELQSADLRDNVIGAAEVGSGVLSGVGAAIPEIAAPLAAVGGAAVAGTKIGKYGQDNINNNVDLGKNADGSKTTVTDAAANLGMDVNNSVTDLTGSRTAGNIAGAIGTGVGAVGSAAASVGGAVYGAGSSLLNGVGNFFRRGN